MKIFYLAKNISSWIPKRINYVLHLVLTARFLVQVSKAVIHIVTPAVTKTVSRIFLKSFGIGWEEISITAVHLLEGKFCNDYFRKQ